MATRTYDLDVFRSKKEHDAIELGVEGINLALDYCPTAWELVAGGILKRAYRFLDRKNQYINDLTDVEKHVSDQVFKHMGLNKHSGYYGEWLVAQLTEIGADHPAWTILLKSE